MLSCLAFALALAAPAMAAALKVDGIVFHENLGDLDILAPLGGAEALGELVKALEARVNADGSFPNKDAAVLDVHLSSTAPPTVTLRGGQTSRGARWALPALDGLPDVRLRAAALDMSVLVRAPGGPKVKLEPVPWPARLPPDLGLAELSDAITTRARDYSLPLEAAAAAQVDARFQGVRAVGAALQQMSASGDYAPDRLYADDLFWRGLLEMTPGNPLVAAAPVLAGVAGGQVEAMHLPLQIFAGDDNNSNNLVQAQLAALAEVWRRFEAQRARTMQAGIAREDAGDHEGAIALFDQVLAATPCSAWALYERGFSMRSAGLFPSDEAVAAQQARVFACDPLFPVAYGGRGDEELRLLTWRLSLRSIFNGAAPFADDLLRFSDAALELGQPGHAGQGYWLAIQLKETKRDKSELLGDMLLAATEAGADGASALFEQGDAMIAAARERRARRSPPPLK